MCFICPLWLHNNPFKLLCQYIFVPLRDFLY
nr:MAG TPA: hypothetical protein [Caudoviricetes sp.]DAR55578.1 MAG TPA: hypothetical protein [Bacteriophage sp.]